MSASGYFDIEKLKGHVKNRIDRVGIELEGGWEKVPKFMNAGEKLERDGSVRIDPIPLDPPSEPRAERSNLLPPFDFVDEIARANSQVSPEHQVFFIEDSAALTNLNNFHFDGVRFRDFRGRIFGFGTSATIAMRLREAYNRRNGIGNLGEEQSNKKRFKQLHIGEIASAPLEIGKIGDWMKLSYPQHVNGTCGLHVHMSFKKSLHYERLMVPEYQMTMINYLSKWAIDKKIEKSHPLWERLSGKNEYCKHEFFADVQAKKTSKVYEHHGQGNRYTVINYCHGQHGTIECRVLPMFKEVDDAIDAIKEVISITNACIRFNVKKEEEISASVVEASIHNSIREVRREVI